MKAFDTETGGFSGHQDSWWGGQRRKLTVHPMRSMFLNFLPIKVSLSELPQPHTQNNTPAGGPDVLILSELPRFFGALSYRTLLPPSRFSHLLSGSSYLPLFLTEQAERSSASPSITNRPMPKIGQVSTKSQYVPSKCVLYTHRKELHIWPIITMH